MTFALLWNTFHPYELTKTLHLTFDVQKTLCRPFSLLLPLNPLKGHKWNSNRTRGDGTKIMSHTIRYINFTTLMVVVITLEHNGAFIIRQLLNVECWSVCMPMTMLQLWEDKTCPVMDSSTGHCLCWAMNLPITSLNQHEHLRKIPGYLHELFAWASNQIHNYSHCYVLIWDKLETCPRQVKELRMSFPAVSRIKYIHLIKAIYITIQY